VPAAYAKPGSIVPSAAAAKATRKETVSLSCIKLLNLPISVSGVALLRRRHPGNGAIAQN